MNWYLQALDNYAEFEGRSRRKEYWFFNLFSLLISLVLVLLENLLGLPNTSRGFGVLSGIYTLAVLLPGIAVTVRRLHDIGKSGWWYLILLVPLVGAAVLLVFMMRDGEPGSNQYGPNPKATAMEPGGGAVAPA